MFFPKYELYLFSQNLINEIISLTFKSTRICKLGYDFAFDKLRSISYNFLPMAVNLKNAQRYIYLADDDIDDRDFFIDAIIEIDPDMILKVAEDGMDLIDNVLTLSAAELPEFIFLDINMPRKSGFECLEEIRNHKGSLKEVNIIMFSTSNDPENIQKALELGATFYAVKPSSFEKLKSLLKEILTMNLTSSLREKRKFLLI